MSLEPQWIALILLTALIHAGWNALNKASRDPLQSMAILVVAGGAVGALALPFCGPLERGAWPWLGASVALHFAYQLSLVRAYSLGDLSQVYPIARGLAPLGVAVFAAATAGEVPGPVATLGLALAAGAIVSLSAASGDAGAGLVARITSAGTGPVLAALQTSLLIGIYTVVDGHGVRAAGDPFPYMAWMTFLHTFPMLFLALAVRGREFLAFARSDGTRNAIGGVLAVFGYWIVLAAMQTNAMASVAALRETSVVFAALIGTRLFGEAFGWRRVASSAVLALGLALMQIA